MFVSHQEALWWLGLCLGALRDVGEDGGGLKNIFVMFTCRTLGEDESILKRAYIFFNIFQMGC